MRCQEALAVFLNSTTRTHTTTPRRPLADLTTLSHIPHTIIGADYEIIRDRPLYIVGMRRGYMSSDQKKRKEKRLFLRSDTTRMFINELYTSLCVANCKLKASVWRSLPCLLILPQRLTPQTSHVSWCFLVCSGGEAAALPAHFA